MNVIRLLDEAARLSPDRLAFIDGKRGREHRRTFAEFHDRSCRVAARLLEAGLHPGDAVAVMIPVSATLYEVFAGALRVGMVILPVDPAWKRQQLRQILDRLPVRAFVGNLQACLFRLACPPLRGIDRVFVSGRGFPGAASLGPGLRTAPHLQIHDCDPETTAMVAFTSGSTGIPKGVVRSHGLLHETNRILSAHLQLDAGTIDMATMPGMVLANLAAGVTTFIPDIDMGHPGMAAPAPLLEQIERWQPASTVASPALMQRLTGHCLGAGRRLRSLQRVFMGGAPVFPRLVDQVREAAPQADLFSLYGSTEAEPIALLASTRITAAERREMRHGGGLLAGPPIADIQLRIITDTYGSPRHACTAAQFDHATLGPDAVGEIVVSGPHVTKHYLGGQGDSANKFRVDGTIWHRTGDAGRLDADGRLWLVGRCTARIRTPNAVDYPLRMETALSERSDVVHSALVRRNDRTVLVLQLAFPRHDADTEEICRSLDWIDIDDIALIAKMPLDRRHNAKTDYPALLRLLDAGKGVTRTIRRSRP